MDYLLMAEKLPSQGTPRTIHDDISPVQIVIPGLTRNPVFSWIPAGVYTEGAEVRE